MLKQLPIKKEYLLVAGTIILLLLCYQFAFKKTIVAWQLNKQLKGRLAQSSDLAVQPAYLLRKSANLSKILDRYRADTVEFRSNAINQIAAIAQGENVKLSEVPLTDPVYHTDKFIIQKVDFEGDFFALTKVFNRLQAIKEIGVIRSAAYRTVTVRSVNNEFKKLILEVYIEISRD